MWNNNMISMHGPTRIPCYVLEKRLTGSDVLSSLQLGSLQVEVRHWVAVHLASISTIANNTSPASQHIPLSTSKGSGNV